MADEVKEYQQEVTDTALKMFAEMLDSVSTKGPRFDDDKIVTTIVEAVIGIVALYGGDFGGIHSREIENLLGAAAQLKARQIISINALGAMQSGVAN